MKPLPPGNILQNIYIKNRFKNKNYKTFLEIGSGNGYLSHLLLSLGLSGVGFDLNLSACQNNNKMNSDFIKNQSYEVFNQNFLEIDLKNKFDVIISSMVIEHLTDEELKCLLNKAKKSLNPNGVIVFLVPSSMKYWGIEDEIAGHIKRYEFEDFNDFESQYQLKINHIAGLTYPLSNWLFKLSNLIVKKNESSKLSMNQKEKTVYTGNRDVAYKTTFPSVFKLVLNKYVMMPFHLLQLMNRKNKNSLVIYCELKL